MCHNELTDLIKQTNLLMVTVDVGNGNLYKAHSLVKHIRGEYYHFTDNFVQTQFDIWRKIHEYKTGSWVGHLLVDNLENTMWNTELKITSIHQGRHINNHKNTYFAQVVISLEDNHLKIIKNRYGHGQNNHFNLTELFQYLSLPLCPL